MTLETGNASVGGESTTAAAETAQMVVAAPVVPAPAAPLEPSSKSYFERMQEAVNTADAKELTPEDQAADIAKSIADAPVSGDETGEKSPEDKPADADPNGEKPTVEEQKPEAPKTPNIPYEELPENMRAELRRSNLSQEVKEALAQSWYERKAFHDVGFTVDQARQLKSVGLTPEAANDRLRLHPTIDDAVTDAQLANLARTLVDDFQTNPASMLDGLSQNAPNAFPKFAGAVAERLRSAAPEVYGNLVSRAMKNALNVLESELDKEDYESREKVAFVRNKWFQQDSEQAQPAGTFNPNDPIHQRYAQMEQQQAQQYQAQAAQFEQAVRGYGEKAVFDEVANRVANALPKGTPQEIVARASQEISQRVFQDFLGNRGVMDNLNKMIAGADLSQQALEIIVNNIYNRAVPLIAVHARPVLEFWSKNTKAGEQPVTPAITSPQHSAASSRTVATAPSAAKVAASSPAPAASSQPPKDFIASGRKQGWDTGKIINAWLTGQR